MAQKNFFELEELFGDDPSNLAMLSIYRTAGLLSKEADKFFKAFNLTDAQYNILIILKKFGAGGLTQVELSKRLLVNRANVTGLIDRLEKNNWVKRINDPKDRRINLVVLNEEKREILQDIQLKFVERIREIASVLSIDENKEVFGHLKRLSRKIFESQIQP